MGVAAPDPAARGETPIELFRRNDAAFHNMPLSFVNFTILHTSDLHMDLGEGGHEGSGRDTAHQKCGTSVFIFL